MDRRQGWFVTLVAAQAAHSLEEYAGRLYDVFPPAIWVSSLLAADRRLGFIAFNVALVSFGVLCWLLPIRLRWPSAVPLAWLWVGVELINGIGHPLWSLVQRGYTPGVATAPLLLLLSVLLAREIRAPYAPMRKPVPPK